MTALCAFGLKLHIVKRLGASNLGLILIVTALLAGILFLRFSEVPGAKFSPTPTKLTLGEFAGYTIVNRYPHDNRCYTQGLLFHEGSLYESCGLYGSSNLREVELETGKVLRQVNLEDQYFGEGLALLDGLLYQLTWQQGQAFVYDLESFELLRQFQYNTEGWGLTTDGKALILSSGSNKLDWLDPANGLVVRDNHVTWQGHPIEYLNELEFINGEIFANIYLSDRVARIDPESGLVLTMLDLKGLRPQENQTQPGEVLNGIAYDAANDRLFVTGKHWAWLYEIKLHTIPEPILPTITPTPTEITAPLPGFQGP